MTKLMPRLGHRSTTPRARHVAGGLRRTVAGLAVAALTALGGVSGCAHTALPAAELGEDDPALDAEAFAVLPPGDQLALAGHRVMALRTTLARVFVRIETLRDAVRARDALADWGQLVCLEERVPDVEGFARRGERAWDALRDALRGGDGEAVWTRFELLRLARLGVSRELAAAHACGSVAAGSLRPRPVVRVEAIAVREPDPATAFTHGATSRRVDVAPALPAIFVPTPF